MKIIYQLTEEQNKIAEAYCQSLVKCGDEYQWFGNMCAIPDNLLTANGSSTLRPSLNWVDGFLTFVDTEDDWIQKRAYSNASYYIKETLVMIGAYDSVDEMSDDEMSRFKIHLVTEIDGPFHHTVD